MRISDLSNIEELKSKIIHYRKRSGLTQAEVAKKMEISRSTYAYAEKNAERITPEFIYKFAKALNISPNLFLRNNEFEHTNVLRSRMPTQQPIEPLILSNKEIRIIKMLRMLPRDVFNDLYESVKNEFDTTLSPDEIK